MTDAATGKAIAKSLERLCAAVEIQNQLLAMLLEVQADHARFTPGSLIDGGDKAFYAAVGHWETDRRNRPQ